jgi:hypothetical protein
MQIPCDSEFLVMGDEMHLFRFPGFPRFPGSPVPALPYFSLGPGNRSNGCPLARVNKYALFYGNKLQNTFLFYLLAL